MDKKTVAVIFGGCSPEYGVSLQSASGVLRHMDAERFLPVPIGITQQGDWYHYTGAIRRIGENTWAQADCTPACISPSRSERALLVFTPGGVRSLHLDAVLPILHGRNGEDGTVQGLCELAGIPLAGCGTLASALCMDKDRAHKLASLTGVRVPDSFVLCGGYDADDALQKAEALSYPLFVKPVKAGSSYGVAKVCTPDALLDAIDAAFYYDDCVMLEEAICGEEVGCAVVGKERLLVGEPDEIELASGFFDYTEKYRLATAKIHVPASVSAKTREMIKAAAQDVYRALGCSGFARVDFFLTPAQELVFNEINTIPGFTPHSRFPRMMQAAGLDFTQLVTHIIQQALE